MDKAALTSAQQQFAAEHHNLIYSFLNSWRLKEDEFYDVVVFGYIAAVEDYFHKPELSEKYEFSTVAYRQMKLRLYDYYKQQNRQKRKCSLLSLDAFTYDGESCMSLHEAVAAPDSLMMELETELIMQELAVKLPPRQMDVLRMKAECSGVREIAKEQKMTVKGVQEMLAGLKDVVLGVCYGGKCNV